MVDSKAQPALSLFFKEAGFDILLLSAMEDFEMCRLLHEEKFLGKAA